MDDKVKEPTQSEALDCFMIGDAINIEGQATVMRVVGGWIVEKFVYIGKPNKATNISNATCFLPDPTYENAKPFLESAKRKVENEA